MKPSFSDSPAHQPNQTSDAPEISRIDAINDSMQVVLRGVGAALAEKRVERAGKRMEKMDHKHALYSDLSSVALYGMSKEKARLSGNDEKMPEPDRSDTADGNPAMPRSFLERFVDKRLERKTWHHALKVAEQKRVTKAFGGRDKTRTLGMKTKLSANSKRSEIKNSYADGQIHVPDMRTKLTVINSTPDKYENSHQRKIRKSAERTADGLTYAANSLQRQSVKGLKRRDRAIETIQTNHKRAERYRASQIESRGRIQERKHQAQTTETRSNPTPKDRAIVTHRQRIAAERLARRLNYKS